MLRGSICTEGSMLGNQCVLRGGSLLRWLYWGVCTERVGWEGYIGMLGWICTVGDVGKQIPECYICNILGIIVDMGMGENVEGMWGCGFTKFLCALF